jgi:hypothetical protein
MFKKTATVGGIVLAALMAVGIGSAAIAQSTDDPTTTTSTVANLPTAENAETVMYEVGDAGVVTVASDGATLSIVKVDAAAGWAAEVEVAVGREVEADFRNGTRRIQFNAEFDDGRVRVRVRERVEGSPAGSSTTTTTAAPSADPTTTSADGDPAGGESGTTFEAGGAGTVTITRSGSSLTIVSVNPAAGWATDIEVASGREVEVDFRNGMHRIQFDAELEDGEIRIRVRDRIDDNGSHDDTLDEVDDDGDDGDDSEHNTDDDALDGNDDQSRSDDDDDGR